MRFDLKLVSEWCLLVYLLVAFGLALFEVSIGVQMIGMFFGIGIGFLFAQRHEDSVWKQKYIKLLENEKQSQEVSKK